MVLCWYAAHVRTSACRLAALSPHAMFTPPLSNPSLPQVGAFQVLVMGRCADAALAPLVRLGPQLPFRDASCGAPCFNLTVEHCVRVGGDGGGEKAGQRGGA